MVMTNSYEGKRAFGDGYVIEYGTWTEGAVGTSGTITADVTEQPEIGQILMANASSNGDTQVTCALDQKAPIVKLTYTAGDAGTYFIIGKAC